MKTDMTSYVERLVIKYLDSVGIYATKYRTGDYEIDVYLPDRGIGFELNGYYYHTSLYAPENVEPKSKDYHKEKTDKAIHDGIKLYHIWYSTQDDLEVILDFIRAKLGMTRKVYARKCVLNKNPDTSKLLKYYHSNSRKGIPSVGTTHNYTLEIDGRIMSAVAFTVLGEEAFNGAYCVRRGVSVIGGAQRLFKSFLNEGISKITVRLDKDTTPIFEDSIYHRLGFKCDGELGSAKRYYNSETKEVLDRRNYVKPRLIHFKGYDEKLSEHQILSLHNIYPIYNSGTWQAVLTH